MKTQLLVSINDPLILIIIGITILAILTWIAWPKRGFLDYLSRIRLNNQRVQLEDALKFLFDCEYKNIAPDVHSLAGNLNISADQASKLIENLMGLGLVRMTNRNISLTDSGRSYSLRVIRVHRIWERYLADETGVSEIDWHPEADRVEHFITPAQAEKMAAQLGNPVFDPHGDPIPSPEGEIPDHKGKVLTHLEEGEIGHIIHIEDEPKSIYQQLTVMGLYPGMQVYVTDVTGDKITFAADGNEFTLTPLFASQITVDLVAEEVKVKPKYDLLSSLMVGEAGVVMGISHNCRGLQRRRLMDLGIVPGSLITADIKSASGDPIGYKILGATIGIRKKQADMIFIEKVNVETA